MDEVDRELIGSTAGERAARTRNVSGSAGSERLHPLVELTVARIREFIREREAVFWVFVFPVLLAFALGIAFRNTAPQEINIGVEGSAATGSSARLAEVTAALSRSSEIEAA